MKSKKKKIFVVLLACCLQVAAQDIGDFTNIDVGFKYVQVLSESASNKLSIDYCTKMRENSYVVPTYAVSKLSGVSYVSDFYQKGGILYLSIQKLHLKQMEMSLI